jgi:hypothetical protein
MSRLDTETPMVDCDGFYAALLAAHEGLDKAQSDALNARLVLILANIIGDPETLRAALAAAKRKPSEPSEPEG